MTIITLAAQAAGAEISAENPSSFALSREQFAQARVLFKRAAAEKRLNAASICAWNILRGADPRRGFSPISNPVKLANGAAPWAAFESAHWAARMLAPEALLPWAALLEEAGCSVKGWKITGSHPILTALTGKTAD